MLNDNRKAGSSVNPPPVREWAVGPHGQKLTLADLPSPENTHWTAARKAEVLSAVDGGLMTQDQACQRYKLSPEEYASWHALIERWGLRALRSTKAQHYRDLHEREQRLGR